MVIVGGTNLQASLQKQDAYTLVFVDSIRAYKATGTHFSEIMACYLLQTKDLETYNPPLMNKIIDHLKAGGKLSDLADKEDIQTLSSEYRAMYDELVEKSGTDYYYACYFPLSQNIILPSPTAAITPTAEPKTPPSATMVPATPGGSTTEAPTGSGSPEPDPTPTPLPVKYDYSNDFLNERNFDDIKFHDGTDIMADEGTPIIAVESGRIETIGWNNAGGWRIGIRSQDGKRFWYYAHMRKVHPYYKTLKKGDWVAAGQLIGYIGSSGYSHNLTPNAMPDPVTLTDQRAEDKKFVDHLHIGLKVKFDDKRKEEWVNPYPILKLLEANKSTIEAEGTDEYKAITKSLQERLIK
ncbi:MAG: peptidoglycan DD-metalloendopeptidase family protein [Clostridia bacterium]|nr:peptidoglycan DD-metalloendopeptidase family protein [Clostridia bacterium]